MERKVGGMEMAGVMGGAFIIDGLQGIVTAIQLIPGLSILIYPIGLYVWTVGIVGGFFWIWNRGLPLSRMAIGSLVEFIPYICALPGFSIATYLTMRLANGQGGGLLTLVATAASFTPVGRGAGIASKVGGASRAAAVAEGRSMTAQEIIAINTSPIEAGRRESQDASPILRVGGEMRDSRFLPRNANPVREG